MKTQMLFEGQNVLCKFIFLISPIYFTVEANNKSPACELGNAEGTSGYKKVRGKLTEQSEEGYGTAEIVMQDSDNVTQNLTIPNGATVDQQGQGPSDWLSAEEEQRGCKSK